MNGNWKKFFALALALILMFTAFVGCEEKTDDDAEPTKDSVSQTDVKNDTTHSNKEDEPVKSTGITSKEDFVATMEELLDLSLYMDLNESDNNGLFDSFSYTLDYENRKEYDLDYNIRLDDGSEFTLPILVSDFEKKGWTMPESNHPDNQLSSGYMTSSYFENSQGKELSCDVYNHRDYATAKKNGMVVEIRASHYSTYDDKIRESAVGFTVCDTLTEEATLEDIIARLGNPTMVFCTVNYNDDGSFKKSQITIEYAQESSAYSCLRFNLSGDKGYIISMEYSADAR